MARRFQEEVPSWTKGVIVTDSTADKIPKDALSRGRNCSFIKGGFPSKRRGCSVYTQTAQSGKSEIKALGNFLGINWTISDDGKWSKVVGGVFSAIDAGNPSPFTASLDAYPSTAIANDLLFAVNGTDAYKTDGTTVSNFGIVAPGAPTVTDSGVAGNPSGTYRVALTALNENTGHLSSLGTYASVAVVGKKIHVAWTFPTDPQVTHVIVNVFKVSLSDRFFEVNVGTNVSVAPDVDTGGYDSGTLAVDLNLTDTNINDLETQSPDTTENDPPPDGATVIFYHGSRMFAVVGSLLYYSKVDDPESFDPSDYETVNSNDGQDIVALATLVDQHLVIIKDSSTHQLTGPNDPNTWEVSVVDPMIGGVSHRSVVATEGSLWWIGSQGQGIIQLKYEGPYTVSKPKRVDSPNVSDRIDDLNLAQLMGSTAAYSTVQQRIFFAVPEAFKTRNTIIIPLNVRYGIWEDIWDPMDVSALGVMVDSSVPSVTIGGYAGRLFQTNSANYFDGVRASDGAGTSFTLTGTITSTDSSSITDSTAGFDTTGDGLQEAILLVVTASGQLIRNRITSNTGTKINVADAWTTDPTVGLTYYVGSPNFEIDTKYFAPTSVPNTEGSSFYSRNFKHLQVKGIADGGQAVLDVFAIIDGDQSNFAKTLQIPISSGGAVFDVDTWDTGKFGTGMTTTAHRVLGLHGKTCGFRLRNCTPSQGVALLSLGLLGSELGVKA